MTGNNGSLVAVGDVAPNRDEPDSIFRHVQHVLSRGSVLFGQLETTVTARGARAPNAKLAMRTSPRTARAIADAGFAVMSFAGNHCLDWGEEGFTDTLAEMEEAGVRICGAGPTISEARPPVVVQCDGATVAFLAYSSILPEGYWATDRRPGCVPLRASTHYEMIEADQPGTPPRIRTVPYEDDLEALLSDIAAAKKSADIVVLSMHWGIHMTPVVIADYQRTLAHAAIDTGADIILGHHPHILKGVEFYRGVPIFYSMGNFAIEQPQAFDPSIIDSDSFKHLLSLHPGRAPEGLYLLPEDTRKSLICDVTLRDRRVAEVAVTPVWIDDGSTPTALGPDDPRFDEVVGYLLHVSREAGFSLSHRVQGDRVILSPGPGG